MRRATRRSTRPSSRRRPRCASCSSEAAPGARFGEMRMKRALTLLLLSAALAGCATRWVVDSDVRTFSSIGTVPVDATYRFERLPSQQAEEHTQLQIEAMA